MDLEAISWFVEVVHTGSFSNAAKRLNQPSSNVSRRIAKLETQLGYRLLLRSTRSLSLTQEGHSLLPLAKQLLDAQTQIQDWNESLNQEPTGKLRITAPSSFARGPLTDWLIRYRQQYPRVDIELIQSNDYLDFQKHQLDCAFRQGPLPNSSLIAKRLFSIHWGVFAAPSFLNQLDAITSPEQLAEYPIISSGVQKNSLPWRFSTSVWQPNTAALLFEDTEQCLKAAEAGLGFTYASRYEATELLQQGSLIEVLTDYRPTPADFFMVLPERTHRSLKSETFIQHIKQEVENFGKPDGLSL